MIYETNLHVFKFQQIETVRDFCDVISNDRITLDKADKKLELNNRVRPKSKGN